MDARPIAEQPHISNMKYRKILLECSIKIIKHIKAPKNLSDSYLFHVVGPIPND